MKFAQGHALVIGVGTSDISCTLRDATGLANLLQDEEICGYPPSQVSLLSEGTARRDDIIGALKGLEKVERESTVIVYFSGHGLLVGPTGSEQYYLIPFPYHRYNPPRNLAQEAISGKEFTDALDKIPAHQLLLLLDCCHAGGFDVTKTKDANAHFDGYPVKSAEMPPEIKDRLGRGDGRVVVASSRSDEKSLTGKPFSVFTTALLEAFRGQGVSRKDGYVRVLDLAMHTRERVASLTRIKQRPVADMKGADNFEVAYYAAGSHEPKSLPAELVWNPDSGPRTRVPSKPRPTKSQQISYDNFRRFGKTLLEAVESELAHTETDELFVPNASKSENIGGDWYFHFGATHSPLNKHIDDTCYFFSLCFRQKKGALKSKTGLARLFCVIQPPCLATPWTRNAPSVRDDLVQFLNTQAPDQHNWAAKTRSGDVWYRFGTHVLSSFDSVSADAVAAKFAANIPSIEEAILDIRAGKRQRKQLLPARD